MGTGYVIGFKFDGAGCWELVVEVVMGVDLVFLKMGWGFYWGVESVIHSFIRLGFMDVNYFLKTGYVITM